MLNRLRPLRPSRFEPVPCPVDGSPEKIQFDFSKPFILGLTEAGCVHDTKYGIEQTLSCGTYCKGLVDLFITSKLVGWHRIKCRQSGLKVVPEKALPIAAEFLKLGLIDGCDGRRRHQSDYADSRFVPFQLFGASTRVKLKGESSGIPALLGSQKECANDCSNRANRLNPCGSVGAMDWGVGAGFRSEDNRQYSDREDKAGCRQQQRDDSELEYCSCVHRVSILGARHISAPGEVT